MELIIPDGVSTILGGGLPSLGWRVMDFVKIAPSFETSTKSGVSIPYPNVPDAANIGFLK